MKEQDVIYHLKIDYNKDKLLKESTETKYNSISLKTLKRYENLIEKSKADDPSYNFNLQSFPTFSDKDKEWFAKQTDWKISRKVNEDPFTETFHLHNTFKRILGLENLSPRFVTQKQGTEVHYHVDGFTTCAINFLVKGKQTPISFKDVGDFYYEVALLNTNHSHAVPKQVEEDRILYKLRINGMTFQEAKEKLIAAAY